MPTKGNPFLNFPNKVFIETGSHMGDGVQKALEANFEQIISIEIADIYFNHCKNKFFIYDHVEIVQGDSFKVLPSILEKIDHPITFWLDGHHSCGNTGIGEYWAPLIQELEAISKHHVKTHTILIDDMRCWKDPNPNHGFITEDILKMIHHINPDYNISYIDGCQADDIMVAQVGK